MKKKFPTLIEMSSLNRHISRYFMLL